MFKVLGITDCVTTCDCCGKPNLKCTVELENEAGEVVYYGRDCAGKAVYGRKNPKHTKNVEDKARMVERCRDMLPIVLEAIHSGKDARTAIKAKDYRFDVSCGFYADTGRKMPLRIYFNGWTVPGVEIAAENY